MTHYNSVQFKCDQCADVLKTKENLFRHNMVHVIDVDEEVFVCQFCLGKFKSKSSLSSHLASVHSYSRRKLRSAMTRILKRKRGKSYNLKYYHCPNCSRQFLSKSNLKRHVKNIHQKSRPFKCELCCKYFASKYNRDMHTFRVHRAAAGP